MKKSPTSKAVIGTLAVVVIAGAGFLAFGKGSNTGIGASVYNIGTITPQQVCITSGPRRSSPFITVTSPNGGQSYTAGQSIPVTWTSCNVPSTAQLYIPMVSSSTVTSQFTPASVTTPYVYSANTGTATLTLPPSSSFHPGGYLPGNYYKIEVEYPTSTGPVTGISSNYFTIGNPGITISPNGTPTAMVTGPGGGQLHSVINFNIPFSVTALGQAAYIPNSTQMTDPGGVSAGHYIQYSIDDGNQHNLLSSTGASGTISYSGSSANTPDANGNYRIPAGQTDSFVLNVSYRVPATDHYRASLVNVNWNTNDSASAYTPYFIANASSYQTPYVVGQ